MIQYSEAEIRESRRRRVLDTRWSLSSGQPKAGPVGGHDDRLYASEHAIADREDVILLAAGFFAAVRGGDAIGQMPRSELIRMARAGGEAQLEPALGLARQIQDHDAVGGAKFEQNRTPDDAVTVVIGPQRTLHLGQR